MIRAIRIHVLQRRALRYARAAADYQEMPAGKAWHCGIATALQRRADMAAVAYHRAVIGQ